MTDADALTTARDYILEAIALAEQDTDIYRPYPSILAKHMAGVATMQADLAAFDAALAALDAMRAERNAAAENERDRLYALVYSKRGVQFVNGPWFRKEGAMLPADRAAIRALATQEKPHGPA